MNMLDHLTYSIFENVLGQKMSEFETRHGCICKDFKESWICCLHGYRVGLIYLKD